MTEIWRVQETGEFFFKSWHRYSKTGKCVGASILVQNGSPELIEAIQEAFEKTEGKKSK